jgi:2-oxo-4-hydroxy-4-carboxy-5-ureidoimidazoline decarboxylase
MTTPGGPGLTRFNAMPEDEAHALLTEVCAAPEWAAHVLEGRPYAGLDELVARSAMVVMTLDDAQLDAALAAHPRIGARDVATEESRHEQAGVAGAGAELRMDLVEGNRRYEERFGHVYLVRASGRSAEELLALLHQRLDNDPETERSVVRRELAQINALRLQRLLEREE